MIPVFTGPSNPAPAIALRGSFFIPSVHTGVQLTAPITVPDIIAHIESSGDPYAYRFEPTVYKNLSTGALTPAHLEIVQNIMAVHKCSQSSAMVIYSSSYGLYQIMGFNLYDANNLNCSLQFGCFMNSTDWQSTFFARLLTRMGLTYSVDDLANNPNLRMHFAVTYNGSSVYEDAIVAALQYYNIPVTV